MTPPYASPGEPHGKFARAPVPGYTGFVAFDLISTDFDGTLVGDDGRLSTELLTWIRDWKERTGGLWMINTGRWMDSLIDSLNRNDCSPLPDWLGLGEREVWRLQGTTYVSCDPWNTECSRTHEALRRDIESTLAEIHAHMVATGLAQNLYEQQIYVGMFATSDANARAVVRYLDGLKRRHPAFDFAHNQRYFRFCHVDYHKGACVREVQRLTGATAPRTLCAGDHYNDLPMLDPAFAQHLVCPANAIPEVRQRVTEHGGFVARRDHARGVLDGLRHIAGV